MIGGWKSPFLIVPALLSGIGAGAQTVAPARFAREIAAFEESDRRNPPRHGGVLFVGSSSIRLWKLEKHFPGSAAINRGFGGSRIEDSVDYAHRIITPYRPRQIVFYAGDNDVAEGMAPERIFVDFQILVGRIRSVLPEVPIIFIAIKPSIARWSQYDRQSQTNAMVRDYCRRNRNLHYLDIVNAMLRQGRPRPNLFAEDGLHLSEEGYRLWTRILKPLLLSERPFDPRHFD